jgi:transposase
MTDRFWLSDAQWAVIEPLLPRLGGKPRVNDRRVISGILHRYREGLRWRTIPAEYGPRTTLFNRFNRWSEKGIWQALLAALAACDDPPEIAMVDSTAVRAHRSAAGAKGGSRAKPSAGRAAARRPRSTRSPTALVASTP